MDKRFRSEITVGLFVIAAALILGYISLKISRIRVRDGIDVTFVFSHACGLVKDAPVAVSGVEVGYIKDLKLDSGNALITTRVASSAGLRRDLKATIRSKSLLGEPYLELIPASRTAPLLQDGDRIVNTVAPVQIDQMISWLGAASEQMDPAEAGRFLKALSHDPAATRRIMKNADELLGKLSTLDAKTLREFIQQVKVRARLF
ncbi:MAG: MlaD family protein [Candidatus Aureabacteria bacterium]|nr:MlaD family protein [Candidatus Auribacterota bacterium]